MSYQARKIYRNLLALLIIGVLFCGCTASSNVTNESNLGHGTVNMNNQNTNINSAVTSNQNASTGSLTKELEQLTGSELEARKLWTFSGHSNDEEEIHCNDCLNKESANLAVTYVNEQYGIQLDVPYNYRWGNIDYRILPYEEFEQSIWFGPLVEFESGWIPQYKMDIIPSRTYEEISNDDVAKITKKTISGMEVAQYERIGMCDVGIIEVLGKDHNYQFYPVCGSSNQILEQVISTLKQSLDPDVFDNCGEPSKYSGEIWYSSFANSFSQALGTEAKIQELCFAPDKHQVIFIAEPTYCGEPHLGFYDTEVHFIKLADNMSLEDDGCETSPRTFGKRVGDVIEMFGSNGDAGCGSDVTFDYDYVKNQYRKKSSYSYCYNGLTGNKESEVWNLY